MNKYPVGELRPSQIMFSYGIGAIADLPNLAALVMGLDEWRQEGTVEIAEERLLLAVQKQLGQQVQKLLSLPIPPEENNDSLLGVPVAPFPTWMVCPRCKLLAPVSSEIFQLNNRRNRSSELHYHHPNCPKSRKYPPKVIPVRFMVACEKGHLDDFPWRYFVHGGTSDCNGSLRLLETNVSGSVTDILVCCDECGAKRPLAQAFGIPGKQNMPKCRGRHPHLRSFDDDCNQQMKTLLLGASNSWFSLNLSALSIPTTAGKLEELIRENWVALKNAQTLDNLELLLQTLFSMGQLQSLMKYPSAEIWATLEKIRQNTSENDPSNLKDPEWQAFIAVEQEVNIGKDWHLVPTTPPPDFRDKLEKVILVQKLREVRALMGFTRIQSPGDFSDTGDVPDDFKARLSRQPPKWVPAMEVRGEGIFIQFNETALQTWEQQPLIRKHYNKVKQAHKNWLNQRNPDLVDKIPCPSMRYLLLHSFAHALMRQFALECGYNAASLRERIYAQMATETPEKKDAQAGVLIYTAAPDSEGTLGGLVYLGESQRLNYHLNQAFEYIRICASDPLCSDHNPDGDGSIHWAACHACLFSPETSCERGNKYLDRTLLIPTLAQDLEKQKYAFFQ
ncbi:DUF1998 domain-containing protein [Spirulina subsalsa]|uniref:DUF1998 domain-containing protein n=1 Tax=Spirulina subsalsa TaxID=54311 RepID=UPI0002FC6FCB|nr:DUF1998 domain-containing protein [Spirulina subsalsa]